MRGSLPQSILPPDLVKMIHDDLDGYRGKPGQPRLLTWKETDELMKQALKRKNLR